MGVTYNYNRHLTVGVDYSLQKWADVNYKGDDVDNDMHETYTYCDRHKISMGAEYIPNLIGRSYLAHNIVWELIIRLRIIKSTVKRLPANMA